MFRASSDGGRRCGHSNVSRTRAANRAQWALRCSKNDVAHPSDLTPRVDDDDDSIPTIAESRLAVRLSPRLRAQLVALMPLLLVQEKQRAVVRNKLWEAEATLEIAHTTGMPGEIDIVAVALGRAELADQASARRLAAWALSNGGFLSVEAMHASLVIVAAPTGAPARR